MSKPSPARYGTMNWSSCTTSLRKLGSRLIWLDNETSSLAPPDGSPGRPAVFSDAAIQFGLTIEVLLSLPPGQTTGMLASLMTSAKLDRAVPDDTTFCRRQKTLAVQIPYRRADGPLHLLFDSTSIRFLGDGAWQARSRIETERRGMKAFGERIAARHPDSQTSEIQIHVVLMNCFPALGTVKIVRVG